MAKLLAAACAAALLASPAASPAESPRLRVLVFTKTAAYRHDSIPAAVRALRELGAANGIGVEATEDASAFADASLRGVDVVAFVLTTGDVLDAQQQAALERFVRAGGGFVGVHSASDTEYDWPWYGGLVGAYFREHPAIQPAVVEVVAREASTARLPRRWQRTDEWYAFRARPAADVRILARLDESTYEPGGSAMGGDHPIAWAHAYGGGRAWYTAGGHTAGSYAEPLFRQHLLGGILSAAGYGTPRVASATVRLQGRRAAVTIRAAGCFRCAGQLRVRLGSRVVTTTLRATGSTLAGRTPTLPPGRRRIELRLEDRATGLTATGSLAVRRP
jgi:type 1 glutamine amidotransferase